jgi:L,D-transpeptidase ErfK/SrfK
VRIHHRKVSGIVLCSLVAVLATVRPGVARKWVEEDFWPREVKTYTFVPPAKPGPESNERTVIGDVLEYQPEKGDTFFDLARHFDLGYNELVEANPGVDEWIPGHFDTPVIVPQQFVLPSGSYSGIVINVPEMRLYHYRPAGKDGVRTVVTFPVGLGREEWKTPIGKFTVGEKTVNPTWVIPASIRKERIADKGYSEAMIPGGDPRNPLGKYRMRLSLDLYGIHGTNIPWGVGMLVSHGCVRLYPEDIEKLYPMVPTGTPGAFVYQPIKVGMADGRVYVEVHKDLYGMKPGMYRETRAMLEKHGFMSLVDEEKLRAAALAQTGIPVDVTVGGTSSPQRNVAPAPRLRSVELPENERAPDDLETEQLRPVSGTLERSAPAHVGRPVPSRRSARTSAEAVMPVEIVVPSGAVEAQPEDAR